MRFFEFSESDASIDKFVMILRNYIGRSASKNAPAKLNWAGLSRIFRANGFEFAADYETFKSMYDSDPAIQNLVKNFDKNGIELKVPGAPDDQEQTPQTTGQTSQDAVDKMAASAAPQQLAAQA